MLCGKFRKTSHISQRPNETRAALRRPKWPRLGRATVHAGWLHAVADLILIHIISGNARAS